MGTGDDSRRRSPSTVSAQADGFVDGVAVRSCRLDDSSGRFDGGGPGMGGRGEQGTREYAVNSVRVALGASAVAGPNERRAMRGVGASNADVIACGASEGGEGTGKAGSIRESINLLRAGSNA